MSREANVSNLKTEKDGISILHESMPGFMVPNKEVRQFLYELCHIDFSKYSRSVDAIQLLTSDFKQIKCRKDFMLL